VQRLRRPETLANLGLQYSSASDRLQFMGNVRIARDAIDVGSVPLDDYEVVDVSMSYAFNNLLELYARIENATDEEYQEVIGYHTPGRAGHAGVRFRF
jgi:vitamin B12 transporter